MSFITQAFGWLLRMAYLFVGNYFWALVLFALVVRLIQVPFQMKSKRSSMRMARLTPKIKELEKKFGDDKQKLQQAQAALYKAEKINPMSGCLWSILPLVIIFLLYGAIRQPLTYMIGLTPDQIGQVGNHLVGELADTSIPNIYQASSTVWNEIPVAQAIHTHWTDVSQNFSSFLQPWMNVNFNFLGIDLGNTPQYQVWNFGAYAQGLVTSTAGTDYPITMGQALWQLWGLFLLPVVSGAAAFISMRISMKTGPQMPSQGGGMKGMMLMGPAMSLIFGFMMPGALSVYWFVGSVLITVQEVILNKHYKKVLDAEDAARHEQERIKEEELEKKRLETERLRAEGKLAQNKNTSKKKQQALDRAKEENRQAAERARRKEELGFMSERPASQVDTRRYARGRAYVEDRYSNPEEAEAATARAAAESENGAPIDEDGPDDSAAPDALSQLPAQEDETALVRREGVEALPDLPDLPELPGGSGSDKKN
ncbi:MAG: YidC/Oxa1 family membrane protein insertase [Firmicutes bacterium]|nr:YidC/Oxa1 family membrane protein insertase [Bacillota bacterium]